MRALCMALSVLVLEEIIRFKRSDWPQSNNKIINAFISRLLTIRTILNYRLNGLCTPRSSLEPSDNTLINQPSNRAEGKPLDGHDQLDSGLVAFNERFIAKLWQYDMFDCVFNALSPLITHFILINLAQLDLSQN